jgi:hypothetical protein
MVAATRNTKRPLNRCTNCGKTWYPRGTNLSTRCPKCGSSKTKIAGLGIIGTLGSLFLIFAMGGHPGNHNNSSVTTPSPDVSTQSTNDASTPQLSRSPALSDIAPPPPRVLGGGADAASEGTVAATGAVDQVAVAKPTVANAPGDKSASPDDIVRPSNSEGSDATFSHH